MNKISRKKCFADARPVRVTARLAMIEDENNHRSTETASSASRARILDRNREIKSRAPRARCTLGFVEFPSSAPPRRNPREVSRPLRLRPRAMIPSNRRAVRSRARRNLGKVSPRVLVLVLVLVSGRPAREPLRSSRAGALARRATPRADETRRERSRRRVSARVARVAATSARSRRPVPTPRLAAARAPRLGSTTFPSRASASAPEARSRVRP